MVKSKLLARSGFVALRQLNPIHKRGHKVFFLKFKPSLFEIAVNAQLCLKNVKRQLCFSEYKNEK